MTRPQTHQVLCRLANAHRHARLPIDPAHSSIEQQERDEFFVGAHPVGDRRGTRPTNHRPQGWAPTATKKVHGWKLRGSSNPKGPDQSFQI